MSLRKGTPRHSLLPMPMHFMSLDSSPKAPPPGPPTGPRKPGELEPDSRRAAVIGLVVTAALIVLGLILVKVLGDAGRLQDCVLSGRTNCAPVDQ
jgi:hypothetical protein